MYSLAHKNRPTFTQTPDRNVKKLVLSFNVSFQVNTVCIYIYSEPADYMHLTQNSSGPPGELKTVGFRDVKNVKETYVQLRWTPKSYKCQKVKHIQPY